MTKNTGIKKKNTENPNETLQLAAAPFLTLTFATKKEGETDVGVTTIFMEIKCV